MKTTVLILPYYCSSISVVSWVAEECKHPLGALVGKVSEFSAFVAHNLIQVLEPPAQVRLPVVPIALVTVGRVAVNTEHLEGVFSQLRRDLRASGDL